MMILITNSLKVRVALRPKGSKNKKAPRVISELGWKTGFEPATLRTTI